MLDKDGKVIYAEHVKEVAEEPDYSKAPAALKSCAVGPARTFGQTRKGRERIAPGPFYAIRLQRFLTLID